MNDPEIETLDPDHTTPAPAPADDDTPPKGSTPLEVKEFLRARKHAKTQAAADAQKCIDLDAIMALEDEYGETNVVALPVPYSPGLPTMIAARTPSEPEIKRYRHRLAAGRKAGPDKDPDPLAGVKASEEVADVTRIYPDDDTYARLRAARPGIHVQLGAASVKLATAGSESEGKA